MMNLAIYDAFAAANGSDVNKTFYKYGLDFVNTTTDETAEVAAIHGAYTVLSQLYSDQQASLDSFYASSISGYSAGAITSGVQLGAQIGNTIVAKRANDGWNADVSYTYVDAIGSFQPDPLNPDVPVWGPGWGQVDPFMITSTDAHFPSAMPAIDSAEYAASYNEVKQLGSVDSMARTADQTEAGLFWAYDVEGMGTPLTLYNNVLTTVAQQEGNTAAENAALFAQASVAMADAGIVAWDSKFEYELWRPVTAIHDGDIDGNPLTEGDASWTALGAPDGEGDVIGFTPQFPTYVSGHATFGGAVFGTLMEFYGTDDISFELTSEELVLLLADPQLQAEYGLALTDATRSFDSFSEAMAENGRSRVYLGIHFDFDDLIGQEVGQDVASYVTSGNFVAVPAPATAAIALGGFPLMMRRHRRIT
ncbi:MAG: vanadium-dependent haloperoxidase, partial [Planctomycetota bacterium]